MAKFVKAVIYPTLCIPVKLRSVTRDGLAARALAVEIDLRKKCGVITVSRIRNLKS